MWFVLDTASLTRIRFTQRATKEKGRDVQTEGSVVSSERNVVHMVTMAMNFDPEEEKR